MRIDLNAGSVHSGSGVERPIWAQAARAESTRNSESGASEPATNLNHLAASAMSSPEVRAQKIQALQAQIGSGSYAVPARQVADSMLEQIRVRRS
jgi:flagellar biosynthesis anti-sigma factor FlgM